MVFWLLKNILIFQCLACYWQIGIFCSALSNELKLIDLPPLNILLVNGDCCLIYAKIFASLVPNWFFLKKNITNVLFVFLLYSIGSRTDGPNQEKKKKRWWTSPARQTGLGFLSEEVCFLRDSSIQPSPSQTSGNTLNVYEPPTQRWKTTWKFYHTVDQTEQTTITR